MKKLFAVLIAIFVITSLAQNSYASYQLGKEAFDNKRYTQAMNYFLAEPDDANSAYYIGLMYQNGLGVKKNYSEAFDWYEKGMGLGGENSRVALARLYTTGLGAPPDADYALKLLNNGNKDDIQNRIATVALLKLGYGADNSKELSDAIISSEAKNKRDTDNFIRQVNQFTQQLKKDQSEKVSSSERMEWFNKHYKKLATMLAVEIENTNIKPRIC